MQSYDGFWLIPRNFVFFARSCCDTGGCFVTNRGERWHSCRIPPLKSYSQIVNPTETFSAIRFAVSWNIRIFASDMAKTYQSFSRRLSRRLILIVLVWTQAFAPISQPSSLVSSLARVTGSVPMSIGTARPSWSSASARNSRTICSASGIRKVLFSNDVHCEPYFL